MTTVRDSDGDLKGIKVGEKEVSTILFAQNKGRVPGVGTAVGVVAQMEDIVARHVDTYANKRVAVGARMVVVSAAGENEDKRTIVEAIDPADILPKDAINVPIGAVEVTDLTEVPYMTAKGTAVAMLPEFDVPGTPEDATDDETEVWRLQVDVNGAAEGNGTDELGQDVYRYFIAITEPKPNQTVGGTAITELAQVVELTVVQEESKLSPKVMVREDESSAFSYISYGVWANVDAKRKPTDLGAGYMVGMPENMTPVANMPITGTASFEGQYTSYVLSNGSRGTINEQDGDVSMSANFGRGSMSVMLMDQFGMNNDLTLSGSITDNTFSGTGMKDFGGTMLQSDGATAKLEGAFFGEAVDEAGGVYDVLGGSKKDPGRVVGAFGGVNTGN